MPRLLSWSTEFFAGSPLHALAVLLTLMLLEAVLSADNAIALASLVRQVEPAEQRQRVLNWGLVMALVLRVISVFGAGLVMHNPAVRLLGGGYLVWLAVEHFQTELRLKDDPDPQTAFRGPEGLVSMVLLVGGTDLAFSLDSVSAAMAVTDQLLLVVLAGGLGVLLLRCVAVWMLDWMEGFPNLQNAGYLTVMAVGLRLVGEVVAPALVPTEPLLLAMVMVLFSWGFLRTQATEP